METHCFKVLHCGRWSEYGPTNRKTGRFCSRCAVISPTYRTWEYIFSKNSCLFCFYSYICIKPFRISRTGLMLFKMRHEAGPGSLAH